MNALRAAPTERLGAVYNRIANKAPTLRKVLLMTAIKREIIRRNGGAL